MSARLRTGLELLAWLALAYLAAALWRYGGDTALAPDSGYYILRAELLTAGKEPYRDFVSMYPPGIYFLQRLHTAITGLSPEALHRPFFFYHLGGVLLMLLVARRGLGLPRWAGVLGGAWILFILPLYDAPYYVLEPISGLFGWAGITVAACASTERRWRAPLLAGVLAGGAPFIKQVGLLHVAAVALIVLVRWRSPRAAAVAVGAAAGPFIVFALAFPSAVHAWFTQSFALADYAANRVGVERFTGGLERILENRWVFLSLAGAIVGALFARPRDALVLVLGTTGLIAWLPVTARPYHHYYLYPLPFAAIAAVWLLVRLRPVALRAVAAVILLWSAFVVNESRTAVMASAPSFAARERAIGAWIAARAGERAVIGPDSPQLYLRTGIRPPIPHYAFALYTDEIVAAREQGLPIFLIDRGNFDAAALAEELAGHGFERFDTLDEYAVSAWRPVAPR